MQESSSATILIDKQPNMENRHSRVGIKRAADPEASRLWEQLWADRSLADVRTALAHRYEFVIPCVIRSLGRGFKSHWERDELHTLGYIGLLQSIDNFAPGSNPGQFCAYATLRVRGVIMDELRSLDFFPRAVRENVTRINEATERLTNERGVQPTRATIADAAGLTREQGENVLAAMQSAYFLQLDQYVSRTNPDVSVGDTIPSPDPGPEAMVLEASNREELIEALLTLPARERTTLSLRYFGKLTQLQIAGMLNVSHSRVCQIEKSGIENLRTKLVAKNRSLHRCAQV